MLDVGAPSLVIGAPRHVVGAPGLVIGGPRLRVGAPGQVLAMGPGLDQQ